MKNLEKVANEHYLNAWKDNNEEWSPRGSFKAGFHKAIEVLKLYEQEDAIECLRFWAENGFTEGEE